MEKKEEFPIKLSKRTDFNQWIGKVKLCEIDEELKKIFLECGLHIGTLKLTKDVNI